MTEPKYDLVWFAENTPQARARALTRQDIKPYRNIGVRIRTGMRLPLQDGTPRGDAGTLFIVGKFGTLGFDPDPKDKTQPLANVMIEVLEPGLVVGNFKPDAWTSPEFVKAAKDEEAAYRDEIAKMEARKEQRAATHHADVNKANRRFLVTVGHLMNVRQPSVITNDELSDVALAGTLLGRELPDHMQFITTLCPEPQTAEECPPEIADDWVARAAHLQSRVVGPRIEREAKRG